MAEQQNIEKAFADWSSALEINPKLKTVFYNRGNLRLSQYDIEGALADFDQAVASDPRYAVAYNNRAIVRVAKGDMEIRFPRC